MCVQQKGHGFEGPVQSSDIAILSSAYPNIDFKGLGDAMSIHGFVPLASDLALVGAVLSMKNRDIRFFPFAGVRTTDMVMVKLPVMKDIVGWLENTALGSDMWLAANSWLREHHKVELRFTMDCGCGIISTDAMRDGTWHAYLQDFNGLRKDIFGRTDVVKLEVDDISNTDLTKEQLDAWLKLREVLFSLSPRVAVNLAKAA